MKRAAVPAFLAVAAAVAAVALWPAPSQRPALAVVALRPGDVQQLAVEWRGERRTFHRTGDGEWQAPPGGSGSAAALLATAEDRVLPMLAYRVLRVDPSDPQFGLAAPELTLTLDAGHGPPRTVALGASTFTGAGFYARRSDDMKRVYLVPRRTMNDLRSVLLGQPVSGTDSAAEKLEQAEADRARAEEQARLTPYLDQVLSAGGHLPDGIE